MQTERGKLDGIIDIEPPPPPVDAWTYAAPGALAAVLLIVGLALLWKLHRSTRRRARVRSARLRALSAHGHIDAKDAAFELAAIMRSALGLRRVSACVAPPAGAATQATRWVAFMTALEHARYAPHACEPRALEDLFAEARFWLRRRA